MPSLIDVDLLEVEEPVMFENQLCPYIDNFLRVWFSHWLAGGGPELLQGPMQGLQAATEHLGTQLRAAGGQV